MRVCVGGGSLQVHGTRTVRRAGAIQLYHNLRQVEEGVHGKWRGTDAQMDSLLNLQCKSIENGADRFPLWIGNEIGGWRI